MLISLSAVNGLAFVQDKDILCCRQDDVEILDTDTSDAFAAYYADDSRQADREVVFNAELGLAMEALPAGMTVQELWNIA